MRNEKLYPIGDAARRSGLSISAVRFYADEGLIEPTDLTEAGHRLYDIDAIARLELVRTLRELDTDLDGIRRFLDGETNLTGLLATHLRIVERQERALRARTAVLRSLIKQGGTAAQATLMHKLVSMNDEERARTVDHFWDDVSAGLDVPEGFIDRQRTIRPVLSADPTAAQLEAWIELGDLVQDAAFRDAVRAFLQENYSTDVGRNIASAPFQDFVHESGAPLVEEVLAAYRAGESPRSPRAQQAITRFLEGAVALADTPLTPEIRNRMAEGWRQTPGILRRLADEDAAAEGPLYDDTHGRYLDLVAAVNGTTSEEDVHSLPYAWMADAMAAPAAGS